MKHEDIIRLAIEHTIHGLKFDEDGLVRFANLVAQHERERIKQANAPEIERINTHIKELEDAVLAEREACAKVCKKHADVYAGLEQNPTTQSAWAACIDNRDAIRARGQA